MLGPVVAQLRHLVRTTVTAVRGAWECINANRTGYTVNLAWTRAHRSAHSHRDRGSDMYTVNILSDIMARRLCHHGVRVVRSFACPMETVQQIMTME